MGLGKVILAIFGIIMLLLVVVGVDIYLTYNTFSKMDSADIQDLVSNPEFTIGNGNSTVTISVDIDLPKAGFIPKGVILLLTVTFDGESQQVEKEVQLGDSKTLNITFTLTTAHAQKLSDGGSLSVDAEADVTPTLIGYAIEQVTQTIDLGSQTVQV